MNEVIDLFCGCGGLSLGAVQAGFKPSLSIDVDPVLSSKYSENFRNSNLLNADLSEIDLGDIENEIDPTKLVGVIGGPPCQGFSVMGRRDLDDPRNKLLKRYFEVVAYFQPKFFLMENVPGLLDSKNRGLLDEALSILPSKYKTLEPAVLNAADFGAATSRPRLIVVGYDPYEVDSFEVCDFENKMRTAVSVEDAISDLPSPSVDEWLTYKEVKQSAYASSMRRAPTTGLGSKTARAQNRKLLSNGFQITNHTTDIVKRFAKVPQGKSDPISKYPRLKWQGQANVLRAGTGNDKGSYQAARPIHPVENRVISVREAARIQGFPDWFQFHDTKWHSHRMIGNSVSPIFAREILKVIRQKMI